MASALPIFSQKGNLIPLSSRNPHTSFLPTSTLSSSSSISSLKLPIITRPPRLRSTTTTTTTTPLVVVSSSSSDAKIVRCPVLDRHATKNNKLRFARKLKTLLLSKPRHFLPLRILSRCRSYLGLHHSRPLLPMILRYPALFRLFHAPSHTSPTLSLLSVTLTPAAAALAADESVLRSRIAADLASKLHRLLMLASPHHRLLLSKLVHLAPDLGLPVDFRSRLCNAHQDRFRTADTSYGRALELVSWDPDLAAPLPPIRPPDDDKDYLRRPIIDRPPRFKQLKLRRGLNLKRWHRDYLIRFHELPEVPPYSLATTEGAAEGMSAEEAAERRACAVVREVLGMTVEKRTLVDHLTHFRKELGLPNRLRAMLLRHPEMFYVSIKGQRDSVFLVEAYDDKGRLLVPDELLPARERLMELVREGKRMRRERRRGTDYNGNDDDDDDDDDDGENDEEDEEDNTDGFDDLFDSGIGDDWEDFVAATHDVNDDLQGEEIGGEFWSMKAAAEGVGDGGGGPEAW